MKLLCLPHAGGTASRYHRWTSLVPPHIDIVPLELNGRGDRMSHGFYASFAEALDDLTRRAASILEPGDSFAIFGHSMGAYIALELESAWSPWGPGPIGCSSRDGARRRTTTF
ncbi:alpha/beta fold hydrolase [Streptomyces cyaneofuscatus]|uniref:thioesterase II family protein n=1 Tax=Streptomyces cyaneofuscatus TaxID=66883 RepID=UPI003868A767|nr:alpha/beta fold hydrolase [Streptomyces cyaneofuscatus]